MSNGSKTGGGEDGGGVREEGLHHALFFTDLKEEKKILIPSIRCETRRYNLQVVKKVHLHIHARLFFLTFL